MKSSTQIARHAWPIGVGLGATLPWCAVEIGVGWQLSWHTLGFALCLGACAGFWLVAPLRWFRDPRWLAVVVITPAPFLVIRDVHWAFGRVLDLLPWTTVAIAWLQTVALAAITAAFTQWCVRRYLPARPFWRWFSAVGSFLFVASALAGSLLGISRNTGPWTGDVLWLAGWVACALFPKRHLLCPLVAVASGLCLHWIPDEYPALQAAFAAGTVGTSLVTLHEWTRRWLGDQALRPAMSLVLLCLIVGSGALASAHLLSLRSDGLWLSKRGKGGVVTALVTMGRTATDLDRDGYGLFFGQTDCRSLDPDIHPGQLEKPNNGVDDNCLLGDAKEDAVDFFRAVDAVHPPPAPFSGDLVIVLVDSLRFDDATSLPLPAIQELFRTGVFYERAYTTATYTGEALMGILAGRLPMNIDLRWRSPFNGCPIRPPGGLAVRLGVSGFDTAMVGAVDESLTECFLPHTYGNGFSHVVYLPPDMPVQQVTNRAIGAWKALDGTKRRFMLVYYLSVHNAISSRQAYQNAIIELDRAFGRLRREVATDALWVLLADHGEEWYEHGHRGHAQDLNELVVHVPLVVAGPGIRARRVHEVTSLRTLAPTLISILTPTGDRGKGPFFCIDQHPCRDQIAPLGLRMQTTHMHGLVVGDRKVVRDLREGWSVAYDLKRDPQERLPLTRVPEDLAHQLDMWAEHGFSAVGDKHLWPYDARD